MEASPRLTENMLCKFFRHHNKTSSSEQWKDCTMTEQDFNTQLLPNNKVKLISAQRESITDVSLPLISRFPCGGQLIATEALANEFHLNLKRLPRADIVFSHQTPRKLSYNENNTCVSCEVCCVPPDRTPRKTSHCDNNVISFMRNTLEHQIEFTSLKQKQQTCINKNNKHALTTQILELPFRTVPSYRETMHCRFSDFVCDGMSCC